MKNSPAIRLTVIILVLSTLVPIFWFEPAKIILNGDPFFVLDPVRSLVERWSLWQGKINLGAEPVIGTASLIHQFLQALPALLGASDRTAEIFHFVLWFTLPGLTIALFMSTLVRRLKISQWAIPVTVVFYLFNLYRMANFGDNNHFVIYATTPLLLYFVTLAYEKGVDWRLPAIGFILSTLLSAQSGTNPPMYFMLLTPVAIYGLTLGLIEWREWARSLAFWGSVVLGSLMVNLFWIIPFMKILSNQQSLSAAGNLDWLADLSRNTSTANVVRLIGAWAWFDSWRGEPYTLYATDYLKGLWYNLALVPAILAAAVILFRKGRQPLVLALLVIGLVGLVFAHGTHPPFSGLFRWAVEHLPFFWSFRSPWYKFSNMEVLGYATLIGLTIGLVADWLERRKQPWLIWPLVLAPIVIFLAIVHPMFNGTLWQGQEDVDTISAYRIPYPTHIREAADWLNSQPGNTAVALLPYQGAAIYKWGFGGLTDPFNNFSRRPVFARGDRIGYMPGETSGATTVYRVFKERLYADDPTAEDVARLLGIEYLVVRKDLNYTFYDDTDSPEYIKERLSRQANLKLVKSFGEWDIYQWAKAAENPVFATTWADTADQHPIDTMAPRLAAKTETNPFPALFYSWPQKQPDPASVDQIMASLDSTKPAPKLTVTQRLNHYTVSGSSTHPFALVLNQSYSNNWQASSTSATLVGPAVANSYAPTWLVKPSATDGTFVVTIAYTPQQYIWPSVIISLFSIGFLIFMAWKLRSAKKSYEPISKLIGNYNRKNDGYK